MPSYLHELLLLLFRNSSRLAPELLQRLQVAVPEYDEGRVESADLPDIKPAAYHADLVWLLLRDSRPVLGIVVEIQLSVDEDIASAAILASASVDLERSQMYLDFILRSLSDGAKRAMKTLTLATYEYQSDFALECIAKGRLEGRAQVILRQLVLRFGGLTSSIEARIRAMDAEQLDCLTDRVVTATTLDDVLGAP